MPELPEVEVTRLSFADRIAGARILTARLGKPLRWPLGCSADDLVGRTVGAVRRRGKYLLLELDDGVLLVHLGMSGRLVFAPVLPAATTHDHFELTTSQGVLRLRDPRRFGAVVFTPSLEAPLARKLLGGLGVEPLSAAFQPETFHAQLKKRRVAIKQVLLAGDIVVGVGNIYASEALFMAGIRPTIRAGRLSLARTTRLHGAIREVLSRAIERGGSTLKDFSNADGEDGHFQLEAMVYGREGLECRICHARIRCLRQGQRSTFFCPDCQKS
jgi:formamidopyrimidine-DNA glycosylase